MIHLYIKYKYVVRVIVSYNTVIHLFHFINQSIYVLYLIHNRLLPWRGARSDPKGHVEDVRPINWANRPKSYIKRTDCWDEYPNGRWGDGRSPAFGELSDSHFFRPTVGSREDRLSMWGECPLLETEIYEVFASYLKGTIPLLPWCESALKPETAHLMSHLIRLNRHGFMSINSQPAVNGVPSNDNVFGWGGDGGYVYQRAYIEFFVAPNFVPFLSSTIRRYPQLSMHAVNLDGKVVMEGEEGVTALTWGVFPNKEILQPTVFDPNTFLVWSKEAFQLWLDTWACLYDDASESSSLIYKVRKRLFLYNEYLIIHFFLSLRYIFSLSLLLLLLRYALCQIHDTYYLVAIIDNDYIRSTLFTMLEEVIVSLKENGIIDIHSDE